MEVDEGLMMKSTTTSLPLLAGSMLDAYYGVKELHQCALEKSGQYWRGQVFRRVNVSRE
jgi:hypothetical protein